MKAPMPRILTIAALVLACGVALGLVIWQAGKEREPSGDAAAPTSGSNAPGGVSPADFEPVRMEFERQVKKIVPGDIDTVSIDEREEQVRSIAQSLRKAPDLAASLTRQILESGDSTEVQFFVFALGSSGTDEARAGLLELLVSDTDPKAKMIAAASYALGSSPVDEVRFHLPGFSKSIAIVKIGAIKDEAALQAIRMEWQFTEDKEAEEVYFRVLRASAGTSDATANALWEWVQEDAGQRAAKAKALKGNAKMQGTLVGQLLDKGNSQTMRVAAATILSEDSMSSNQETVKALVAAVGDTEADVLERSLVFSGMDSSIRGQMDLKDLNTIIASKAVPDELRVAAMEEVRRRFREN